MSSSFQTPSEHSKTSRAPSSSSTSSARAIRVWSWHHIPASGNRSCAVAEWIGLKMPALSRNWLSMDDIAAILHLAGFEEIKREWRQLLPKRWFGLGPLINRFIAPLPLIRRLCVRNYMVFRSLRQPPLPALSATIVIPCRNERGNIIATVERMPHFAPEQEIIFVEGHSRDGTLDEIRRAIAAHPEMDIKVFVQDGKARVTRCEKASKWRAATC